MPTWLIGAAYLSVLNQWLNPWKSAESIKKLQERKLRALIDHAYRNVSYYRTLLDSAGVRPRDIRSLADLERIPPTSKADLHALPEAEKTARNIKLDRCYSFSTSGATGIPLRSYFTRHDAFLKNLAWIRSYLHCGVSPWLKMASFVGRKEVARSKSWYEYLGLWRRMEISAWDSPETWVRYLLSWRPRVLTGYVMTLRLMAEYIRDHDIQDVRPRFIIHSSAILDKYSRELLQSVLKCPIIDIYGSDEGGCLAWECPRCRAYHVSSDSVILEVLKNGKSAGPGEDGEVVLTNLHSMAMPFIRYRQADIVKRSPRHPVCGRNFPLLESIEGRRDDFIIFENGESVSPHPFYHCLDPVPGIKRWKITQDIQGRLKVEIIPKKDFAPDSLRMIEGNLRSLVKDRLAINIVLVETFPLEKDRKFRAVRSHVRGSS